MTAIDVLADNAATQLSADVTTTPAAGTVETWTVQSTAAPFPQIGTAGIQQFRCTVGPDSDPSPEIIICQAIPAAGQFQVQRGAGGSPVKTHVTGDPVTLTITRDGLDNRFAKHKQTLVDLSQNAALDMQGQLVYPMPAAATFVAQSTSHRFEFKIAGIQEGYLGHHFILVVGTNGGLANTPLLAGQASSTFAWQVAAGASVVTPLTPEAPTLGIIGRGPEGAVSTAGEAVVTGLTVGTTYTAQVYDVCISRFPSITIPGEPWGMAVGPDNTSIIVGQGNATFAVISGPNLPGGSQGMVGGDHAPDNSASWVTAQSAPFPGRHPGMMYYDIITMPSGNSRSVATAAPGTTQLGLIGNNNASTASVINATSSQINDAIMTSGTAAVLTKLASGWMQGRPVQGPGIAAGVTVSSVVAGTSITLSTAPDVNGGPMTLRFLPYVIATTAALASWAMAVTVDPTGTLGWAAIANGTIQAVCLTNVAKTAYTPSATTVQNVGSGAAAITLTDINGVTTALASGSAFTSLTFTNGSTAVAIGDVLKITSGGTTQMLISTSALAANATGTINIAAVGGIGPAITCFSGGQTRAVGYSADGNTLWVADIAKGICAVSATHFNAPGAAITYQSGVTQVLAMKTGGDGSVWVGDQRGFLYRYNSTGVFQQSYNTTVGTVAITDILVSNSATEPSFSSGGRSVWWFAQNGEWGSMDQVTSYIWYPNEGSYGNTYTFGAISWDGLEYVWFGAYTSIGIIGCAQGGRFHFDNTSSGRNYDRGTLVLTTEPV